MILSITFLLYFLLCGILMVRMLLPGKKPVVRIWLGICLGILLCMQLPALYAYALRFSVKAHIAAAVTLPMIVGICYLLRDKKTELRRFDADDRRQLEVMLAVCIPLTVLSGYLQHTHMLMEASDGSYWGGQATYGDLCMHLSFITSMRNMAFPPSYNLLIDTNLSYPYLTDSLSTTMMLFGMDLHHAVTIPGTLLMGITYAGYMLLADEILRGRNKAAAVCAVLFFLNGGLGFLYDFDMAWKDDFEKIKEIFYGYYKTPANQPDFNLRWSNVIADLMLPQRALMGGWAMGIPALYLVVSSFREHSVRQSVLVGLWASALPMVHTHTFLALGLFSGGFVISHLITDKGSRKKVLLQAGIYLGIVLCLAMPQLIGNAIRQTVEGGVLRFQFNWVNNSGGRGFIDGYFWFWIKNVGLVYILILLGCLLAPKHGNLDILLGMSAIYLIAETILFQRNEYDNNKLLYIWFMFAVMLAADYGTLIMERLKGVPGRNALCALFLAVSVMSGTLSVAREAVSGYQLFSKNAVDAGKWIDENTDRDAVFLTGQQHLNPVCSLAGRQILCGSDLYVYFHGLSYQQQANDCQRFYEDPLGNQNVIFGYDVDYIYVSDYERSDFEVDLEAIDENYELVYENPDVRIYKVDKNKVAAGDKE